MGMNSLEYLLRDTWSQLSMEPFELRALAAMLDRVEPATEAEKFIRQRVLDANHRRLHRPVLTVAGIALDRHLQEMHACLVYGGDYELAHFEEHERDMTDAIHDERGNSAQYVPHIHI